MIRSSLLCLAFSAPIWVGATHVLGGEMYYDRLTGNSYRITLKLYRDCGPGNANGTGFDPQVQFAIYDGDGLFQFSSNAPFPGEDPVPVLLNDPCLNTPPAICARWAEYTSVINLPPNTSGYVISYQRCCRTPAMVNLPTGLLQGLTCTVQVPPSSLGANSSPRFNSYPPVAMCLGRDMNFDHSATDPDGDELVYDLFTPFAGGTATDPAPLATPPPYASIQWAAGYSAMDPMDGDPGLSIDPNTGIISVHPTLAGAFTVGVRVREFRNGTLLSSSIRDLRFDVVPCDMSITAVVEDQDPMTRCTGLTIEPVNAGLDAPSWLWDFGDPNTTSDTASSLSPTWTYADSGSYVVTLIAGPGLPCADTSFSVFTVYEPISVTFARPPVLCVNEATVLTVQGDITGAADVIWDFGEGAVLNSGTGAAVSTGFTGTGAHVVRVDVNDHGCEAMYADTVHVHPIPTVVLSGMPDGCLGEALAFEGSGEAWTPLRYFWDLGDGSNSSEQAPEHVYERAGEFNVSLTVVTDEGCEASVTGSLPEPVEIFPLPIADFIVTPDEVSLLDPVIQVEDRSQLAQAWEYHFDGNVITAPSFSLDLSEAGSYAITLKVTSGAQCVDEVTHTVHVVDHLFFAPNAFTPDGDGVNDTFLPVVRGARLYELVILDRWGEQRFRTTDPLEAWTGDGLSAGVYSYLVRLAEHGAFRKEYRGQVTLLR